MEIHRLKPMKDNYPEKLFNEIYEQTHKLRKKLSSQIDPRRYGVSPDIIESWFDDKFIYVFNKHFTDKDPDVLKGFIINSLQTFKFRVLRGAYSKKSEYLSSVITLDGEQDFINIIPDVSTESTESIFIDLVIAFMKDKLSDDAFLVLQIQLNPPPYIINRIGKSTSYISNKLLMEFLDLGICNRNKKYISNIRKEITLQTEIAKEYFNTSLATS
jgi:hypothetical protein